MTAAGGILELLLLRFESLPMKCGILCTQKMPLSPAEN